MKYILFIETSDVSAEYVGLATRELGLEPLFIFDESNYQSDTLRQLRQFKCLPTKTFDSGEIIKSLSNSNISNQIQAVTTFLDSRLPIAAEVAKELHIPGLPVELIELKDKNKSLELVPEVFPESISFDRSHAPIEKIKNLLSKHSKVLFKPRFTAGGVGVITAEKESELPQVMEKISQFTTSPHLNPEAWIVQAHITGKLVSLEGFIENDLLHIWGATGRKKIGNTESQALFPYNDQLSNACLDSMSMQLHLLLTKTNFKHGLFHVEFIINPHNQSWIIDPNLGRIGGGGLIELLSLSHQITPIEFCKFLLQMTLFPGDFKFKSSPVYYQNQNLIKTISLMYGSKNGGLFQDLEVQKNKNLYHTQLLDFNAKVPAMGKDNWCWLGILSGTEDIVFDALSSSRLKINSQWEPLCF